MRKTIIKLQLFNLLLVSLMCSCTNAQKTLSTEETDEGIWVRENDKPVLFYQKETNTLDGKYPRANYVHPLYHLNGEIVTEDFPEDHYHQRGIFWTWHQVFIGELQVGDPWLCQDFEWDVSEVNHNMQEEKATIQADVGWKSPNYKNGNEAFARENVSITVYPLKNGFRVIDFAIQIKALTDSLRIGGSDNEKGYGGFSTRIKLPDDLTFYSENGQVEPQNTAVDAGAWVNMNGSFNNTAQSGFVIIQHPDNPGYMQPWILRSKNSMQNPVYPGREPISIDKPNPLVLKYRIVLYEGDNANFNISDFNY